MVHVSAADALIIFQSTPPVKAATIQAERVQKQKVISIHAAREGGDDLYQDHPRKCGISIHAAREGGDAFLNILRCRRSDFNPRRP